MQPPLKSPAVAAAASQGALRGQKALCGVVQVPSAVIPLLSEIQQWSMKLRENLTSTSNPVLRQGIWRYPEFFPRIWGGNSWVSLPSCSSSSYAPQNSRWLKQRRYATPDRALLQGNPVGFVLWRLFLFFFFLPFTPVVWLCGVGSDPAPVISLAGWGWDELEDAALTQRALALALCLSRCWGRRACKEGRRVSWG